METTVAALGLWEGGLEGGPWNDHFEPWDRAYPHCQTGDWRKTVQAGESSGVSTLQGPWEKSYSVQYVKET